MKSGEELHNNNQPDGQQEPHIVKMSFDVDVSKYQEQLGRLFGRFGEPIPPFTRQKELIIKIIEYSLKNGIKLFSDSFIDLIFSGDIVFTRELLKSKKAQKDANVAIDGGRNAREYSIVVDPYETICNGFGSEIVEILDIYGSDKATIYNGNILASLDLVKGFIKKGLHNKYGAMGELILLADRAYVAKKDGLRWQYSILSKTKEIAHNTPVLILTVKD